MFADLFARLTGTAPDPDPELDAQFAIVALLVRLAKADKHYAVEEIAEIDRTLAASWDLNAVAAMKLRAKAEKVERTAPDTDALAQLVREHTPYPQRAALYEALWNVSLADRALHDEEQAFLDDVAGALGITSAEVAEMRQRHETRGPSEDTAD